MAQFIVISKTGSLHLCDCVRIAKKSLIMATPVDGDTKVPKDRCFYYDKTKYESFNKLVKYLDREKEHTVYGSRAIIDLASFALGGYGFKKVVVKSTRF